VTVELVPLAAEHAGALRAIHATPEVSEWWHAMADGFPFDEPESTRLTILVDGEVAGLIQYGEEPEPDYRHAWIDVFVGPAHAGRGAGTEAVRRVLRLLHEERGHHRVTIDPAVGNPAAIRCYEKAGFTRVGVMRLAERGNDGTWHDAILMEHVVAPRP
jgi:aminoglycoside 6'-N-acetyltransferase